MTKKKQREKDSDVKEINFDSYSSEINITVIGIGGSGCNAINNMIDCGLDGVDLIAIDTDYEGLEYNSNVKTKLFIGDKSSGGLSTKGNPKIGLLAAVESRQEIENSIWECDLLFIVAGLGGGTGSGAAPVIAKIARAMGIITVGLVTMPFSIEGRLRKNKAKKGLKCLKEHIDAVYAADLDKLDSPKNRDAKVFELDRSYYYGLCNIVKSVKELVSGTGFINVDFEDIKEVLRNQGDVFFGLGRGSGEERCKKAVDAAFENSFSDICLNDAKHVLLRIVGNEDMGMLEFSETANLIEQKVSEKADIRIGMAIDDSYGDEIGVTIIATGFTDNE